MIALILVIGFLQSLLQLECCMLRFSTGLQVTPNLHAKISIPYLVNVSVSWPGSLTGKG